MLARGAIGRLLMPLVIGQQRQCCPLVELRQRQDRDDQPPHLGDAHAPARRRQLLRQRDPAHHLLHLSAALLLTGVRVGTPPLSGSAAAVAGPENDAPGSLTSDDDATPANSDIRIHPTPPRSCSRPTLTLSASASPPPTRTPPGGSPGAHYSDSTCIRRLPPVAGSCGALPASLLALVTCPVPR